MFSISALVISSDLCVSDSVKSFNLPMLVLGGGGYTISETWHDAGPTRHQFSSALTSAMSCLILVSY